MAARGALEPRSSPVAVSVDSLGSNLNLDFTCFVFTFWFQTWDRMWDRIPTELRDRNGDRMRLTNRGPKPWTELCDRNRRRNCAEMCDRNFCGAEMVPEIAPKCVTEIIKVSF